MESTKQIIGLDENKQPIYGKELKKVQPLQPDTLTKISQSIIANQIAYDLNHEIKFTQYYKQDLKQKLNQLQPCTRKGRA